MKTIYRLELDKSYIKQVQEATETTDDFGLEPTHGIFASAEWWQHIRDGTLPVHHLKGRISSLQMGSMNDWPEFTFRSEEGKEFTWSRYANNPELAGLYTVGRPTEIDYVVQRHRATCLGPGTHVVIPIVIRVDETFEEKKERRGPG